MQILPSAFPFIIIVFLFCAFLRFPIAINGDDSSSTPLAQIPRDLYHSSDELLKEVSSLVGRHPDTLSVSAPAYIINGMHMDLNYLSDNLDEYFGGVLQMETMTAGNRGYMAEILVITFNRVKKQKADNLKFRILLSFGQHGREIITTELALHLLLVLTGELGMRGINMDSFNTALSNLVIKVVPMENKNGRRLVEAGDLCERRNGRGVDLNRNWSVDWGKKEKDYDPYEENPGVAPFSEPEAQIMREITKSFNPHIWVTVHSGMEALFMPYDHKNGTPDGFTSKVMNSLLVDLNHHHFQDRCVVGSGGGAVGYFAHGTTTDYMHDVAKVPVSFTFEIHGDNSASPKDCFKMFNPVDDATFKRVLNEWCKAFLELFENGLDQLKKADVLGRFVSIGGNVVDGSLVGENRERRKMMDGLELGMQELRTYFRLFLLSSVLLMFMFCSRISKSKLIQTNS